MNDVIIQLVKGNPANIVDRVIMDVTGSPYSHTRIYFPVGPGFTCESTVWGLRSGMRMSMWEMPCDVRLRFKEPWTYGEILAALDKAIDMENSRAWYNFALTVFDIVLYPTRGLWKRIYARTGWAPFTSARTNCSECVDLLSAVHVDLWPGMPASLTVPGDYLSCDALEVVT